MEREIANLAAHCALQGFRYMAFPPLVFDMPPASVASPLAVPAETPMTAAAAQTPEEQGVLLQPVPDALPVRRRTRRIALLDDATSLRPSRREPVPPRLPRPTAAPDGRAPRRAAPTRAEHETPPARAERQIPPARAERATRYALLRDLSDDQR